MGLKNLAQKLLGLPLSFGLSWMSCGSHVTRYTMYLELARLVPMPTRISECKVLSISHSERLIDALGFQNAVIVDADYPEHNAVDLHAFEDSQFDYVLSDQVLEHVEGDPQRVFNESLRLLKPGGIAVHTTCFINPVHGFPSDFWRFTPEALVYLASGFSKVVASGGFGNRAIWLVSALGLRMTPVPHMKWHPLHIIATKNNPKWPVSTWVVAQK